MARKFPLVPASEQVIPVGLKNYKWDGSFWRVLKDVALTAEEIAATMPTAEQIKSEVFSEIVGSAPETLDTLVELAAALGNDPNFATTVTNAIAGKASTSHIHPISDISNLQTSLNALAPKFNPVFTGAIRGNLRQTISIEPSNPSVSGSFSGAVLRCTSATSQTLTVVTTGFSVGDRVDILRDNVGEVSIAAGSGVTLVSVGNKRRLNDRYSGASIICVASGLFHIVGDLKV